MLDGNQLITRHHDQMNCLAHAQEIARRFNEAEVIQQSFESRCALRRLLGSLSPFPDEVLDDIDWQEAVRSHVQIRAIALTTS